MNNSCRRNTDRAIRTVTTWIQDICRRLPFLLDLNGPNARLSAQIGARNETFVDKGCGIADQHSEMFPAKFLEEIRSQSAQAEDD
jgi:hypothetical protein